MENCIICGHESDGYHFGVQACRACSSFFRRCIAERKIYKCRKSDKCTIKHDARIICRACRFRRCNESGMKSELVRNGSKMEVNCTKKQNFEPQHIFLPTTSIIPFSQETFESSQSYPVLNRLLQGIRNYISSQKSLYTVEHPEQIFNEPKFTPMKKFEFDRIEKCCISLINSMLSEYFDPYDRLITEEKMLIIKPFSMRFSTIIRCYQSSKIYPQPNDSRLVVHYGYYINEQTLKYFFGEHKNVDEISKIIGDIIPPLRELANKLNRQEVREIDMAALSYLIFIQECDKLSLCREILEINKTLLFGEMHANFVQMYGFENGGIKFANLLCLLNDTIEIHNKVWEAFTIGKIFLPDWIDIYEELLSR